MKQFIFHGWTIMRVLRVAAGTAIAIQGALVANWLLMIAGIVLGVLALLNIGCCATGACGYTFKKQQEYKQTNPEYEEVV
jgi:CHASE2 domain-containing sensor protein